MTTYTYDKNGNEKTSVIGSVTTTYAYDIENRLTSVTSSSSTTTYAYSAEGRRLKRVAGGTTTYFGNDPVSPSRMDDTIEEYTSTGTKTTTFLHGTGVDELLGYKTIAWSSYHRDALGSVTRLMDSGGTTASTYRYDAFGAIRAQTGSGSSYEFASREIDSTPNLYYSRARYYDPGAGRFLSADPTKCPRTSRGSYVYGHDNPANRIDPSGSCDQWQKLLLNSGCDIGVGLLCGVLPPGLDIVCGMVVGWLCSVGVDYVCGDYSDMYSGAPCSAVVGTICTAGIEAKTGDAGRLVQAQLDWACGRLADFICALLTSGASGDSSYTRGGGHCGNAMARCE